DPALPWIFSDWLQEQEEPSLSKQGELLRLLMTLITAIEIPDRPVQEDRLRLLLELEGATTPLPTITNSLGMRFALIPPGVFLMGSPKSEIGHTSDEGPQRPVHITRPFVLGCHPVTQGQYRRVVGSNPASFRSKVRGASEHPVESVSWDQSAY